MRAMLVSTLLFSGIASFALAGSATAETTTTAASSAASAAADPQGGPNDGHEAAIETPAPPAKGCSHTIVFGVQGNYPLQDFGSDASHGVPVSQNLLAATCPVAGWDVTFDWWNSTGLTSHGVWSRRGTMDEDDFEWTADRTYGPVKLEVYGAYYALDLGRGLGSTSDDFVQVYGELSTPVVLTKDWTASPFVRLTRNQAVGSGGESLDSVRFGVRFDGSLILPIFGGLDFHGEVAHATNFGGAPGAYPHIHVWRGEADLTKKDGWKGWSATLGVKLTQHVGITPIFKISHSF